MEELYSIMRDFLEVEYNQQSLLCLLEMAKNVYSGEKWAESQWVVNGTAYYLEALGKELAAAISRLDRYITENAKK